MNKYYKKINSLRNSILYGSILVCIASFLLSCGSEFNVQDLTSGDSQAPSNPTVDNVLNSSGSVTIECLLPPEEDVLYLMAEYNVNGVQRVVKSSFYKPVLFLDGFPEAGDYKVIIKAVDRNENESSGIQLTVSPTTPSYIIAGNNISIEATFSGVIVRWQGNVEKDELIIQLLGYDDEGEIVILDDNYTDFEKGWFLSMDPSYGYSEREFGVVVIDRWGNTSQATWKSLQPLFDEQLDHTKMSPVRDYAMPGAYDIAEGLCVDVGPNFRDPQTQFAHLFDGQLNTYYETGDGVPPFSFTFDLGVTANLSRYKYYQRDDGSGTNFSFNHNTIKKWRVYGSLTKEPCLDHPSWKLLGTYEMVIPSGEDVPTQGDFDAADAGFDYFIDIEATNIPVRFIRFAIDENWSGGTMAHFGELMIWGVILDN
ncbi:DUF5000 domain-containing lipoprotein [Mariniphaga sp.]|uniref:DUF5000 domain-containing lipoprotein n=1 Tax=Mariniphaga sp. TaxID=1954475 RepID=UPI003565B7DB